MLDSTSGSVCGSTSTLICLQVSKNAGNRELCFWPHPALIKTRFAGLADLLAGIEVCCRVGLGVEGVLRLGNRSEIPIDLTSRDSDLDRFKRIAWLVGAARSFVRQRSNKRPGNKLPGIFEIV